MGLVLAASRLCTHCQFPCLRHWLLLVLDSYSVWLLCLLKGRAMQRQLVKAEAAARVHRCEAWVMATMTMTAAELMKAA